jgi:hypothetical protein
MRKIFGPMREGVTGGWRKVNLHRNLLHDLYSVYCVACYIVALSAHPCESTNCIQEDTFSLHLTAMSKWNTVSPLQIPLCILFLTQAGHRAQTVFTQVTRTLYSRAVTGRDLH